MSITRKDVTRRIRALFYIAAMGYAGSQMVAHHVIAPVADKTASVAHRIGVTEQRLQQIAESKFHIFYNDDAAAPFFRIAAVPDMTHINFLSASAIHGEAWVNPLLGHGTTFDRMTAGISGELLPCTVIVSGHDVTIDDFRDSFSQLGSKWITNIPGAVNDYVKLLVYHELAHCSHLSRERDRMMFEYLADKQAIDAFLEDGGNPEVARAWLHARTINAMQYMMVAQPKDRRNYPYTFSPLLLAHYFGGGTQTVSHKTLHDMRENQEKAALWLWTQARTRFDRAGYILKPETMSDFIYSVLSDPHIDIPVPVRALLEANREAITFFRQPAQTARPVQKTLAF